MKRIITVPNVKINAKQTQPVKFTVMEADRSWRAESVGVKKIVIQKWQDMYMAYPETSFRTEVSYASKPDLAFAMAAKRCW